ncbi:MAG: helix-turn-helix transcriptional regulator [Anaerolineales bacterium]|nr:helix-turn-helix transcriptional regulator [Anaerolineales bacterium]
MAQPQLRRIRSKKLGVLIRDARESVGKSKKECADALDIPVATFGAFERGVKSPSLPQLEIYAYYLDMPMTHFWGNQAVSELPPLTSELKTEDLLAIRQDTIAAVLNKTRVEAGISYKELSEKTGISSRRLKSFETAQQPIPLPDLETLMETLSISMRDLMEQEGPIQEWMANKDGVDGFMELPPDLRAFVSKPVNRPFLEVAERLSQMPVEKLRSVAEGLLEITF